MSDLKLNCPIPERAWWTLRRVAAVDPRQPPSYYEGTFAVDVTLLVRGGFCSTNREGCVFVTKNGSRLIRDKAFWPIRPGQLRRPTAIT